METILLAIVTAVIGIGAGYGIGAWRGKQTLLQQQQETGQSALVKASEDASELLGNAANERADIIADAESVAQQRINEAEGLLQRRRRDLDDDYERIQRRRKELDKRNEKLEQRDQQMNKRQSRLDRKENELKKSESRVVEKLQGIAQMTVDEARQSLLDSIELDARNDMARIIRQVEAEARETADHRARKLIAMAVQRLSSEHVSEVSVSVVPLPSDDMKGRIIGRNGAQHPLLRAGDRRRCRRRRFARGSNHQQLRSRAARGGQTHPWRSWVTDGRIHPARIEKLVGRHARRSRADRA